MPESEYPKTFVRRGTEIIVSTHSDEVAAKFDGFTEKQSTPTAYAGGGAFGGGDVA